MSAPAGLLVGRKPVLEALERQAAGAEGVPAVEKVLVSQDPSTQRWWKAGPSGLARRAGVPVQRAPRQALDRLAEGVPHQGVVVRLGARRLLELDEVLDAAGERPLLVLADGITDPRNLGALVRSAAAAGADGVLVPERHAAGFGPAVAKAAAGALDRIPLARVKNVQRALEALAARGIWTIGLHPDGSRLWDEVDLRSATCLVVGGEGRGLSRLARERCDVLASLPLSRGVESLNAAVAASIALFEAVRQRQGQD